MTKPRPNYRKGWHRCPNCFMSFMGTQEGLCPNCTALSSVSVSPRVAWGLIVLAITLLALAITGIWYVVSR